MGRALRLGTRGSQLALWQANAVKARIAETGGPLCHIVVIKTSGDRLQQAPLSEIGGKRLFVKEIEDALLGAEIDLAVHSSKDMPAVLPDGLTIAAVLPREDPHDAVVLPERESSPRARGEHARPSHTAVNDIEELVAALGQSPSIGTGSIRRIAQLTRILPGARFTPIRGNLDTRLRKLDEGERGSLGNMDALVLAAAGLKRLGFGNRISLLVPAAACVPAPGQGIVAIETRGGDEDVRRAVAPIDDPRAAAALAAERSLVEALGGGCQTPIGALATAVGDDLELIAAVVALDGSQAVRERGRGPGSAARRLGAEVAERLLARGAKEILDEAARQSSHQSPVDGLKSATMTDD
ncbi:MAG TPA: hydroxymethylbilane synthase [Vicinamibacterales bacterium]|nr:hydroxymethylbilane synthase [Vicinamibacterales bacterium]